MILDLFSLAGQVGIVTGGGQGLGKVFLPCICRSRRGYRRRGSEPRHGPNNRR